MTQTNQTSLRDAIELSLTENPTREHAYKLEQALDKMAEALDFAACKEDQQWPENKPFVDILDGIEKARNWLDGDECATILRETEVANWRDYVDYIRGITLDMPPKINVEHFV